MTWTDPTVGSALFDTNDIPTEGNFDAYLFDNLLSLMHPLETPTTADNDITLAQGTNETTLYSVTVPANALGINGSIEMELHGDLLYNNSASDTLTLRVKFGGSTYLGWVYSAINAATTATRLPWILIIELTNQGVTNAQEMTAYMTPLRNNNVGLGDISSGTGIVATETGGRANAAVIQDVSGTVAIDTTVNQALLISAQWSAASANNSFRRRWARTLIGRN